MSTCRYVTTANAVEVGTDFGAIAIKFLAQHRDVLRQLGINYRVDWSTDATHSRFEITDSEGTTIAMVLLSIDASGLMTLTGTCNLSKDVHVCAATEAPV